MKKLVLLVVAVLAPVLASAGSLDLNIGNTGFSIGVSTSANDTYVIGGWDVNNLEPVAGYGKELFPIKHNGVEIAYISATHQFAVGENGRGAFGFGFGTRPVALINSIGHAAGMVNEVVPIPKWAGAVNQFLSVEAGYSRRGLFGDTVSPGRKADVVTVGGQLQVPVGDFFALFGSK